MKEGFTIINAPRTSYKSCIGCKYYSSQLVCSGPNPIHAYNCGHPNGQKPVNYSGAMPMGNLDSNHTPNWCPYLTDKKGGEGE